MKRCFCYLLPLVLGSLAVGGLVFAQLSAIPEDGSQVAVDTCGLHIQVQNFTDRRVEWALVSKLPPVSGQPEDEESK